MCATMPDVSVRAQRATVWNSDGTPMGYSDEDVVRAVQQLAARYEGPQEYWTESTLPSITLSFTNLDSIALLDDEDCESCEPLSRDELEDEESDDEDVDYHNSVDMEQLATRVAPKLLALSVSRCSTASTVDSDTDLPLERCSSPSKLSRSGCSAASTMDSDTEEETDDKGQLVFTCAEERQDMPLEVCRPDLDELRSRAPSKLARRPTSRCSTAPTTDSDADEATEANREQELTSTEKEQADPAEAKRRWKLARQEKLMARRASGKICYGDWLKAQNEQFVPCY